MVYFLQRYDNTHSKLGQQVSRRRSYKNSQPRKALPMLVGFLSLNLKIRYQALTQDGAYGIVSEREKKKRTQRSERAKGEEMEEKAGLSMT